MHTSECPEGPLRNSTHDFRSPQTRSDISQTLAQHAFINKTLDADINHTPKQGQNECMAIARRNVQVLKGRLTDTKDARYVAKSKLGKPSRPTAQQSAQAKARALRRWPLANNESVARFNEELPKKAVVG